MIDTKTKMDTFKLAPAEGYLGRDSKLKGRFLILGLSFLLHTEFSINICQQC